jgi:hypothetical protein
MYILGKGKCNVITGGGKDVASLGPGHFFGEVRINELTHILRLHRTVVNRMVAVLLCDDTKDTETTSVTPKYAEAPDPWGRETKTGSSVGPEGVEGVAGRTKSARRGGDALQSM